MYIKAKYINKLIIFCKLMFLSYSLKYWIGKVDIVNFINNRI